MTRRELEVTDPQEIIRILDTCKVLHLGLVDEGKPYIVPMNYGYVMEDVEEKKKALTILMKTQTGKDFTFDDRMVSIVSVMKIQAGSYTAKNRPIPAALGLYSEN